MVSKTPIIPQRVRKVPHQFSWVDQRLVRERRIDHCSHPAAALYLFLVTVGDAKGMSYYADKSIMQRLSMDRSTLQQARENLIRTDLVAWRKPLYQVLSFDAPKTVTALKQPVSLEQIFKQTLGGAL